MSFKKRKMDGALQNGESEECLDPLAIETPPGTTDTNDTKLIKSIRRKANPDSWKQVVRKKLRQAGQEYVNAQGKVMAERRIHEGCGTGCHLKCTQRFSEEQRQLIHNAFWKLSDEQKNNFYWKYTSRVLPKRRRPSVGETSKRGCTFKYRFEVRGELLPVCSKFFFATLDISPRRIYYFYEHCYQEDTCMPRESLRGKTRKRSVPNLAARLEEIREHIKSFPSMRLGGGSSKKRYLPAELNLTRMYKLYTEIAKDALKQHWYSKVFHEEFNLAFRPPKVAEKGDKTIVRAAVRKTKDSKAQSSVGVNVATGEVVEVLSNVGIAVSAPQLSPVQQEWTVADGVVLSAGTTVLADEQLQPASQQWSNNDHQTATTTTTTTAQTQNQLYANYVEYQWINDVKIERIN